MDKISKRPLELEFSIQYINHSIKYVAEKYCHHYKIGKLID